MKCGGWYRLEQHHIVPKGKIGGKHPRINDPANLVTVCHECHQDHHTTAHRRIPRSVLSADSVAFVLEHVNPNWLDLWYPV